jgi:ureidoglycolate hydrolase
MTRLPIRELTSDAFARYGNTIGLPARAEDASGPGWRWWAETVSLPSDGRNVGIGYLDLSGSPMRFDWAERHMRSVEVVVPLGGDCLLYVGPPDRLEEPEAIAERDRFEVFRLRPGTGVAMDPGVWHGAPLSEGPSSALVFLLEGTGAQDVTVVRFEDDPVDVEA